MVQSVRRVRVLYGLYHGLSYGTTRAMVADLVPEKLRGTAYVTYSRGGHPRLSRVRDPDLLGTPRDFDSGARFTP